jgi:Tol biopolymer transport system component
LLVATVTAAAAIGWGTTPRRVATPASTLTRVTWEAGLAVNPAVSRDGKLLAYASDRAGDGGLDIWVQQTAGGEPLRLTHDTADDHEPSFSPDGTKIAFRSEREGGGVYLVSTLGGAYQLLIPGGHWPRFSPDGNRIAYIVGTTNNVFSGAGTAAVLPAAGGESRTIPSVINVLMPVWAPDGKHLLLVGHTTDSNSYDWWVVNPDEPTSPAVRAGALAVFERYGLTTLNPNLGNPDPFPKPFDWVENRIIFSATQGHSTNLWEVDISPRTFQIVGAPRRLTEGTELESEPVLVGGRGGPSKLVFSALSSSIDLWQVPVDANQAKARGEPIRVTEDPARKEMPSISSNGRKLAFISNRLGNADVWVKDLDTGLESAVAVTPVDENLPVMSFDGSQVTYAPFPPHAAPPAIYSVPTSGGSPEKICELCGAPTDVSQDGRWVLLQFHPDWTPAGHTPSHPRTTLWALDRTSGRRVEILRHDRYNLFRAHFSPDGQWITFHGDRLGLETREFIARFRGTEAIPESQWIVVTDGAAYSDTPRWSPDGNVLYYLSQRDGFRCIWAQRLEPTTKRPIGAPISILHIHNLRRSISGVGLGSLDLAVSQNKIVFNMIELWSNIWTGDLE